MKSQVCIHCFPFNLIVVLLFLPGTLTLNAQVSPTLGAGLTSLTGQRGDLDIELLTEIISQKQEEVRRELLERKILREMEDKGFALQNFVYSSFYSLLSFQDIKAIEKELLTQISILSLQAGIAEATLQINFKNDAVKNSLHEIFREFIALNYKAKSDAISDKHLDALDSIISETNYFILFSVDRIVREFCKAKGIHPKEDSTFQFQSLFLDIIYEVIRNNTTLKEKGFVKVHPNLAGLYEKNSVYYNKKNTAIQSFYNYMENAIDLLTEYHPLFYAFLNDNQISIEKLLTTVDTNTSFTKTDALTKIQEGTKMLGDFQNGMNELLRNSGLEESQVEEIRNQLDVILEGIWSFNQRHASKQVEPEFTSRDFQFMNNYVQPFVTKMMVLSVFGEKQWKLMNEIRNKIFHSVLQSLVDTLSHDSMKSLSGLKSLPVSEYGYLIKILISISNLDEVTSYEHIFNTLAQVGLNNIETKEAQYLKDIIYFLESYTIIDREQNRLNVEVEPLLYKLLSLYENRVSGNFQLYFSTGLNQTLGINYKDDNPDLFLLGNENDMLNSLSFASEKVGFKYKVWNNKAREANKFTHHRTEKPVVSDYYAFAYGSGLLYNIANLTSAGDNFDYAMVGFGVGIALFNSLDFSIWRTSPLLNDEDFGDALRNRGLVGFSFDIKLTEYLSALGEKRRSAKVLNK